MFLPLFLQSDQTTSSISAETRLIRMLLNETTYLKKVRPSHTVIVDIRLVFNQIISMVEKEQIIVTNCFVDQKWTGETLVNISELSSKREILLLDPRLVWNPADHRNITWIRMPSTSVWYEFQNFSSNRSLSLSSLKVSRYISLQYC